MNRLTPEAASHLGKQSWKERPTFQRTCQAGDCDKRFETRSHLALYCSRKCRQRAHYHAAKNSDNKR